MSLQFEKETARLKKKLLSVSALVEESIQRAVKAVIERNRDLALQVIENDAAIDDMEVDVEEDCLKVLALHQPVATDLRFIIACLKINNDLERIGDLAVNLAERGIKLAEHPPITMPFDLRRMQEVVRGMLRDALDALVNMDTGLAHGVILADDEVDAINRRAFREINRRIRENAAEIDTLIHYLGVSRHMERTADHATNIAEDVIYMIEGTIIRHRVMEYGPSDEAAVESSVPDSDEEPGSG